MLAQPAAVAVNGSKLTVNYPPRAHDGLVFFAGSKKRNIKMKKIIFLLILNLIFISTSYAYTDRFFQLQQTITEKRPLILWLHGCTEDADEFMQLTQLNKYAQKANAIVFTPEQSKWRNPVDCWNWFMPGTQKRGGQLQKNDFTN